MTRTRENLARPALRTMRARTPADYASHYVPSDDGCWLFGGAVSSTGYGNIRNEGAHRWFYKFYVGPIPDGMTIDHLCRRRDCVNPDHLEVVTYRTNNRRRPYSKTQRATCIRGHAMTGDNVAHRICRGYPVMDCRTCGRERRREQLGLTPDKYRV